MVDPAGWVYRGGADGGRVFVRGDAGGLLRFNGAEFKAMPLHEVPGIPNRVVRAMLLDRQGRTWLGMDRGGVICMGADDNVNSG